MSSFLIGYVGGGLLGIALVFFIYGRYREEADSRMKNLRTRVISLEVQRDRVTDELELAKAELAECEADSYSHELDRDRADVAQRKAERLAQDLERARIQLAELGSDRLVRELAETRAELAERERQLARRELIVVIDHNRVNNLQAIKGIGPKLAETFVAEGIESLADLADMTDEDLDKLAVQWPGLTSRIRREDWRRQAAVLVEQGFLPDQLSDGSDDSQTEPITAEVNPPDPSPRPEWTIQEW